MLKPHSPATHTKFSSVSRRYNLVFIGVVALIFIVFAAVGRLINISIWNKKEQSRLDFAIRLARVSLPQAL